MTRQADINAFLADTHWSRASQHPLAGDASSRRYVRLRMDAGTAMLMDAPVEPCGSMKPFVDIAEHLLANGLRAPRIFKCDLDAGFILMEDFGDALLAQCAEDTPKSENSLYSAAVDVLAKINACENPSWITPHSPALLAEMIAPLFDFYAPEFPQDLCAQAKTQIEDKIGTLPKMPLRLALRDYHAENLIWHPQECGTDRIGLLDFQDAIVTHPAYDLASLLQDARRDVSAELETKMIARFTEKTGLDHSDLESGYYVIGLQRNLRILGVFCSLASQRGKPEYLALLPRVWGHVSRTLLRPEFEDLQNTLSALPTPVDR